MQANFHLFAFLVHNWFKTRQNSANLVWICLNTVRRKFWPAIFAFLSKTRRNRAELVHSAQTLFKGNSDKPFLPSLSITGLNSAILVWICPNTVHRKFWHAIFTFLFKSFRYRAKLVHSAHALTEIPLWIKRLLEKGLCLLSSEKSELTLKIPFLHRHCHHHRMYEMPNQLNKSSIYLNSTQLNST